MNHNQNGESTRHYSQAENAVLGALILESESYYKINQILKPEMFQVQENRVIYSIIEKFHKESVPVDMLTVYEEAKKSGINPVYITEISDIVSSSLNIVQHSLYIKQEHIKKQMIAVYHTSIQDLMTDVTDISDVLTSSLKQLNEIEEGSTVNTSLKSLKDVTQSSIKEVEKRVSNFRSGKYNGVPTFSSQLDKITGGWQRGELIIIAARPAMGKTAIALKTLEVAAVHNCYPAMFALEMKGERLIDRLILERTGIADWKYKQGKLTNEELSLVTDTSTYLYNLIAHIDDCSSQTIYRIKSKARILKKKGLLGLIIIDYLQLAESDSKVNTRNEEVAAMSRELKKMAKELDVPVIALSQLNRSVESRADKRPQLSDLRDSGAIEQDADMVCFIHRPEYYNNILQDEAGKDIPNGIEFIIAKYREGATGSVFLQHDGSVKNIQDYSNNLPF